MTKSEYQKLKQENDLFTVAFLDYRSLDKKAPSKDVYLKEFRKFIMTCQIRGVSLPLLWQKLDKKYEN